MHTCPQPQDDVNEYAISGLEAMLAGTLALMSAYVHGANKEHQGQISGKIVSNLCCLQAQHALSPEFRQIISQVGHSWQQHRSMLIENTDSAQMPSPASFSVPAHRVVQ